MVKIPNNRGPNNFIKIESYEQFQEIVLLEKNGKKKKKNNERKFAKSYKEIEMCLVEFWAPFAETCIYVKKS